MVRSNVSLPPLFVPVTVYVSSAASAVGVPVIAPVEVLIDKPVGSDGLMAQLTTSPPEAVGELVVITLSLVAVTAAAV